MKRCHQVILILATIAASWLLMMVVHELGHVVHAWISGGTITRVVLHPLVISRTDVAPNPQPLLVAWGGVIWGCVIPLALWGVLQWMKSRFAPVARFFAGFCLIANGAYIAGGVFGRHGDAGDMLDHGSPAWVLIVVGTPLAAAGLFLWHHLGPHFGLGEANGEVDKTVAWSMLILLVAVVLAELGAS